VNLAELRTALQERREDYSQSSAKLDRKINQSYLDICSRRKWGWLRRTVSFATHNRNTGTFTVNGSTEVNKRVITVSGATTHTVFGKRILIENDIYRIENVGSVATEWTLDRPLRCSSAASIAITVLYDEVALPVGSKSVVECVLFAGASAAGAYAYPNSLTAVAPATMLYMGKDVNGQPTRFAVVRKEPIPAPRVAPTVALAAGAGLTAGAAYKYWYTHVDKQTGAESALGPSSSVTTVSGTSRVAVGSDTARNDFYVRTYRSSANGSTAYLIRDDQGATANFTDSMSDEYLGPRGPQSAASMFLQLYPCPDAEYEVRALVQMEGVKLGDDNDRPLFDAEFHHLILDGAEALMLESSDEQGRANQARQRFEMGIARMVQQDRLNQQYRVVMGGRRTVHGKTSWLYSSGTSEADFKA
jgi:hypothetical protein|tara:strand:- start:6303 stop:7553 length:1251 start_codon:yes stop_codon:yes gene_type:complete